MADIPTERRPEDRPVRESAGATISRDEYWRKLVRATAILLAVWFVVGYCMSIFFIQPLNAINFGGIPFGFWMAQQGSIFVFISLILIFAVYIGRLDREAGLEEDEGSATAPGAAH